MYIYINTYTYILVMDPVVIFSQPQLRMFIFHSRITGCGFRVSNNHGCHCQL